MNSIKIILKDLFKKHSNIPEWHYHLFIEWNSCIGKLKDDIILLKIQHSTLVLGIYEPHILYHLKIISNNIIQSINTKLGATYIYDLDYKLMPHKRQKTCL
jgi:hypothetical protein